MDYQDKLFEQIKEAERNAENQDFPAMEKVWSRLEEKLDKKEAKKTIALWQKIAVAASLLLVLSIGFQFLNSSSPKSIQEAPEVGTTTTKNNPFFAIALMIQASAKSLTKIQTASVSCESMTLCLLRCPLK